MTLNSDEEAGQLRKVSQEDDLAEVDEEAPRRRVVNFSDGSRKSPNLGAAPTALVGSANQSPAAGAAPTASVGSANQSAAAGVGSTAMVGSTTKSPAEGAKQPWSVTSGSNAPRGGPARSDHCGSNAPRVDPTRMTPAASAGSSTPNHHDTAALAV